MCVFEHMGQTSCSFYFRNMFHQWWQQQHFEWRVVGGHLEKHVHLVCWNCHFAFLWFFWHKFHELERQKKLWTRKHHTLSYHHHILHFCCFPQGTQLQTHNCTSPKMAQHRLFVGGLPWLTDERQFLNQCLQYVRLPPLQLKVHRKPEQQFFLCLYNVTKCRGYGLVATGLTLEKNAGMLCHLLCGTRQRVEVTVATSTQGGTTTKTTQNWRCKPNLTSSTLTGSKRASTYRKCNPNWTSSTLTGSKCKRTTRNTTRTQPNWMPFKPNRMCRWGSHHDPYRSCKWRGTNSRSASNCSSSAQRWQKNTLALARVMGSRDLLTHGTELLAIKNGLAYSVPKTCPCCRLDCPACKAVTFTALDVWPLCIFWILFLLQLRLWSNTCCTATRTLGQNHRSLQSILTCMFKLSGGIRWKHFPLASWLTMDMLHL